jgi:putative acetyltransferase
MLRHLIALATEKGFKRVSLETGSWDFFRPAIALYAMQGFTECPPFGAYGPDPNSVFMTLEIDPARSG